MVSNTFEQLRSIAKSDPPVLALVLGSGLGDVPAGLEELASVSFGEVPRFVATTIKGHAGKLVLGKLSGKVILVFRGRFHRYEGHGWEQVERSAFVASELGATRYLATNAAGGIADALVPGSLMMLRGHRWWFTPTQSVIETPYSMELCKLLRLASKSCGIELHEGVYSVVSGPSYETPAEIRGMKSVGADAVGMSTAREMEAGSRLGMQCGAISCITNRAAGLSDQPLDHREVLDVAKSQSDRISRLIAELVDSLAD